VMKNSNSGSGQSSAADQAIDEHLATCQVDTAAGRAPDVAEAGDPVLNDLEALQKKAAERDEFLSLLQHLRADYANYQKRVQKEMDTTRRFASQGLILDLLAGLDNLERAIQSADATGNSAGLLEGIRLVHQQLLGSLARHGIKPVEAIDKPFDPSFHEALLEQPCPDKPGRTVLQELQKGYSLHDRVIRPAKVVVSTAGPAVDATSPSVSPANK